MVTRKENTQESSTIIQLEKEVPKIIFSLIFFAVVLLAMQSNGFQTRVPRNPEDQFFQDSLKINFFCWIDRSIVQSLRPKNIFVSLQSQKSCMHFILVGKSCRERQEARSNHDLAP